MKARIALRLSIFVLFILGMAVGPSQSLAQTADTIGTEASSMDTLSASQGGTKVIDKLSGEFGSFLGDDANAVVTGLRNGTAITLVNTEPSPIPGEPPITTTTTINPPTGKMGYGNVRIALSLARQQLSQLGIDQPIGEQLNAALLGGSVTTGGGSNATTTDLQGILTMRADGMGWGKISQELGYKLGHIMSGQQGMVKADPTLDSGVTSGGDQGGSTEGEVADTGGQVDSTKGEVASGSVKSVGGSGKEVIRKTGHAKDIVTGSGRVSANAGIRDKGGVVTGSGRSVGSSKGITTSRGHSRGRGIVTGSGRAFGSISGNRTHGKSAVVTGSGRSLGSSSVITAGRGHGYGRGIVTGSGRSVGASSGITSGLGGGSGLSKRGGGAGLGRGHKK